METSNGYINTVDGLEVSGRLPRQHVGIFKILEGFRRTTPGFWYIYDLHAGTVRFELRPMDSLSVVQILIDDLAAALPARLRAATSNLFDRPSTSGWLDRMATLILAARRSQVIANNLHVNVVFDILSSMPSYPGMKTFVTAEGDRGFVLQNYPESGGIVGLVDHIDTRTTQQVQENMRLFERTERLPAKIRGALTDGS